MRSAPRVLACHVRVFHFRAPALPAQRLLGGGFGRGAKPPSEWNVQGVRLACGPRAPPCSWTLLIALARAFLRQAPRRYLVGSALATGGGGSSGSSAASRSPSDGWVFRSPLSCSFGLGVTPSMVRSASASVRRGAPYPMARRISTAFWSAASSCRRENARTASGLTSRSTSPAPGANTPATPKLADRTRE